jgi:hypothetical protein
MTKPGECENGSKTTCHECGTELSLDIQKSAAGYYIGFCVTKPIAPPQAVAFLARGPRPNATEAQPRRSPPPSAEVAEPSGGPDPPGARGDVACAARALSLGVKGWSRFTEVIELLVRAPLLVHDTLMIQGEFAARLAERVLRDVQVGAALFSEPIAEKRGPLISPKMYRDIVLPSYDPLLSVLKRHGVEVII